MALIVADRVRETTAVVGTSTMTLLGAQLGFQSFVAIGNANTTYYAVTDQNNGPNWEVGIGTYTLAGTQLSRDVVIASSNGGALVNFTSGTKDVFCTLPAEKALYLNQANQTTSANGLYTISVTDIIYELDDISNAVDGFKNTFALRYNQNLFSIASPFKLEVTINGLLQPAFDYKYDTFWLANVLTSSKGYCLDNSGNLKFADSPPAGSQVMIRTVVGNGPSTPKTYPFKPLDILMGY